MANATVCLKMSTIIMNDFKDNKHEQGMELKYDNLIKNSLNIKL